MSAGLYGSAGGVNHQIKKLYVNVGGVNREIKELWAVKDGVNRKIFSSQKIIVTGYDNSGDTYEETSHWNSNGGGELYTSSHQEYWAYFSIGADMQFDPGISISAGQILFEADLLFEFRCHTSAGYKYTSFKIAINDGNYENLYTRPESSATGTWNVHVSKTADTNIVLNKLHLGLGSDIYGKEDSGWQTSVGASWGSGDIKIAGKPITEVIVSST
ncbi:protein of unknown function [Ruminococcaceae bacterium BL-6]|nr:protein of unknown function [Ruminococcaceae bacterium BL-6]